MAQFEGSRRYIETPSPKTPRAQHSPTFEQIIQGDASWQFSTSPTLERNHDPEEVSSHHTNKKSVLTRVKEKARKLRQSLSTKKKHTHDEILDDQTTPSWGVSLEDVDYDDEEDEDPEYLGAPMYESELAPEVYKETARQHPRADPVVSEKHLWPTSIKRNEEEKDKPAVHGKTITETVSEKLAPAYAAVSDATHTIASKIAGLTISSTEARKHRNPDMEHFTPDGMKHLDGSSEVREHLIHKSPQKWDKGVSVKEYFMNKLEPGEDDRALSQVISEAISPKKSPRDMGMVDKVRDAVTSFLRHEEQPDSVAKCSIAEPSMEKIQATNLSQNIPISTKTEIPSPRNINSTNINSSSHVPFSLGASSMEKPHKETTKATNLSSNVPISTERVVSPPTSISSINVNPSRVPVSSRTSYTEEPSKETIKATNLSSNIPISTKTEVPPPKFTSSTSVNTSSQVPISTGASYVEEPKKETAKATNMSANVPLFIKTEVPPLNAISSTNVNSLAHFPNTHGANIEEPSRETTAANLSSHNPLWIKTEVPPPSSVSSANVSPLSRVPLFRSVSLSSHIPVFHNANSSPLIPVSPNDQEDLEEQTQGRILQAN